MTKVNYYGALHIACILLGKDFDTVVLEKKEKEVEKEVKEKFGVDFTNFQLIMSRLVPLLPRLAVKTDDGERLARILVDGDQIVFAHFDDVEEETEKEAENA